MAPNDSREESWEKFKPWIASLILLPIMIFYVLNKGEFTFIDYFNLLVHEGGHGIFSFFGKFIHAAGGTLMQIILPIIFIYYFVSNKKRIGVQISTIWLGENLMNIGVYAADARSRQLPLLGGNKVYHDWTYLLSETGLLNSDKEIGLLFYFIGIIAFIVAFLMPLIIRNYKEAKIDLEI